MKRWEDAEKQFKLALEVDPKDANTHYNYGIILAEMERWEEAEKQFKLALEVDPKHNASIHNNYGTILEEMERWEEAEEQYKLALEADPKQCIYTLQLWKFPRGNWGASKRLKNSISLL